MPPFVAHVAPALTTYTIIRETDANAGSELNGLATSSTVFIMAGMIDCKNGVVTDLRPPKLSDHFSEDLSSKKAESCA